jgi:hypothetical protein
MSDAHDEPPSTGAFIRPFLEGKGGGPVDAPAPGAAGTSIRPFLVTAGRTASAEDYPVETQVVVTARGETAVDSLTFEYRDIVSLCSEPVAVAEIAARLSLHLGVIRVLVGDLQHQGMVTTYQPEVDANDDVEMIMRVINGLRQLT